MLPSASKLASIIYPAVENGWEKGLCAVSRVHLWYPQLIAKRAQNVQRVVGTQVGKELRD